MRLTLLILITIFVSRCSAVIENPLPGPQVLYNGLEWVPVPLYQQSESGESSVYSDLDGRIRILNVFRDVNAKMFINPTPQYNYWYRLESVTTEYFEFTVQQIPLREPVTSTYIYVEWLTIN